jgi:hypothetical protein
LRRLDLVRSPRGVSLRYADPWIERGFALSEDLPLLAGHDFFSAEKDSAPGAVDDARPAPLLRHWPSGAVRHNWAAREVPNC